MIEREKELVAELVREGKLNQNNYLVKDGSLEYRLCFWQSQINEFGNRKVHSSAAEFHWPNSKMEVTIIL